MDAGNDGQLQTTKETAAGTAKMTETDGQADVISRKKPRKKMLLFACIGAMLILLAAIVIALNVFGDSGKKLQEQLDLGAKYLEEMDYEQALVAFQAALAIEPKNADAYLGIVEVYIRTGDIEAALKYAKEGYEATGDERLRDKLGTIMKEQLDLGTKYLEEMNYEQALVAFRAALSIEPKNVDTYLGIVEVYIRMNDFETALKYAREGYEATGDERLKEKIDMLEGGDIFASNGWMMRMSGYDGEGNLIFWHEYTYNLNGQQTSVAKYNAQGVQEQYLELTYDEEGRPLINYSYAADEGDLSKRVLEYNGNHERITFYEGISDETYAYTDLELDSDGKTLKTTQNGADGSLWGTETIEYDESGNMIKSSSYNADGELVNYSIHTYNNTGRYLQQQFYDGNNTLINYTEYLYDEEGNQIGIREYDGNGVLQYENLYQ